MGAERLMEPGAYCRDVEAHLCRRNAGHLIRIVGPAFELVRGWEVEEIPLSVVFRAIDRTVERREAAGKRWRPVRIEFCEADVLAGFDQWRRAVGVSAAGREGGQPARRTPRRKSLAAHLDHAVLALTVAQGSSRHPPALGALAGQAAGELDALRAAAKTARGGARRRLLARLAEIEGALMTVARDTADAALLEAVRQEAERDLAPYRRRMPPGALRQALQAGADRLLRERLDLPRIVFE